jgi:hypothetical protein
MLLRPLLLATVNFRSPNQLSDAHMYGTAAGKGFLASLTNQLLSTLYDWHDRLDSLATVLSRTDPRAALFFPPLGAIYHRHLKRRHQLPYLPLFNLYRSWSYYQTVNGIQSGTCGVDLPPYYYWKVTCCIVVFQP